MLPDRSTLKRQRLVESAKIEKGQMRHFEQFSNIVIELFKCGKEIKASPPHFQVQNCFLVHDHQVAQ